MWKIQPGWLIFLISTSLTDATKTWPIFPHKWEQRGKGQYEDLGKPSKLWDTDKIDWIPEVASQILKGRTKECIITPSCHLGKYNMHLGLPRWLSGKEPTCQHRRRKSHGFDPWVGKIPWRRKWELTPVFLPGESQTEEPDMLQSMGSQEVGHDWMTLHTKEDATQGWREKF